MLGFKCSSMKNFPHFSIRLGYINCMCLRSCFTLVILPVPTGSYMACAFRWYGFSPYGKMFCITMLVAYKWFSNSIFHCHFFKLFRLTSLFHMSKIKRIAFWFEKLLHPYSWIIMHCIQQATDTNEYDNTSNEKTA